MRPKVKFLSDSLIEQIVAEGRDLLCKLGVEIHNDTVLSILADHGARVDQASSHAFFTQDIIDKSLKTAPSSFGLFDSFGNMVVDLSGFNVNFTPGSAAINLLDSQTGKIRRPESADYIKYAKLMRQMNNIASQSTAMIPSDVTERISDSYRLYLSLLFCEKPVVTGTFTIEAFEIMKDLQLAVRASEKALADKPLTVFHAVLPRRLSGAMSPPRMLSIAPGIRFRSNSFRCR